MPSLLRSAFFELSHDLASNAVTLRRTEARFESLPQCEQGIEQLTAALSKIRKEKCTLRYDLRAGPTTSDPLLERIITRASREHLEGFARVAILVGTAPGAAQMNRLVRSGGFASTVVVFADETSAAKHLKGE